MKNMKNLVALFAATVMTMSLGLSAFAAEVNTTVEGDGDATESFNLVFTAPTGGETDIDQLTMIAYLVDGDTDEENIPAYDGTQTIVAMDQVDGDAGFGSVPVDVDKLDDGYAIAVTMGGTDVGTVAKYLVTYDAETETITVVCGDVDGDKDADADDATYILLSTIGGKKDYATYAIGSTITTIDEFNVICGDVDGDEDSDADDATYILLSTIGGKKDYATYPIGSEITFDVPKK